MLTPPMSRSKEPPSSGSSPIEKQFNVAVTETGPRKNAKAFLMVAAGEAAGTVFPLTRTSLLIGRSAEAEVRVNEAAVSNEHARLDLTGSRCTITDLESTNGTYVNGERIFAPTPLHGGDTIRTGSTTFTFVMRDTGLAPATLKLGEPIPRAVATRALPARPAALRNVPAVSDDGEDNMSLTDVVRTVKMYWVYARRYAWLAATCMCFGIALGIVKARLSPPPGKAWFEMTITTEGRSGDEEGPRAFVAPDSTFKSLPLIKKTLQDLGLQNPTDSMAADVQSALEFEQAGLSSKELWRGEYQDSTPERARDFLVKHVDTYINTEMDKILRVLRADADFDREQEQRSAKAVGQARDRLLSFMEEHPEAVPKDAKMPADPRVALGAGASPARLDAAIAAMEQSLASALRAMQMKKAKPYIDQAADAEAKVAEAKARGLGDQHPDVKNWNNLASTMRGRANQILSAEPPAAEQSLDPDVTRLRQELANLRTRRAQAGPATAAVAAAASIKPVVEERAILNAQSLSQLKLRYAELEREYERAKTEHEAMLKKRETTDRLLERERTSAEARYGIITPPTAEAPRALWHILKRAGFGGAVGLGLALVAAVCLEIRRMLIARGHI